MTNALIRVSGSTANVGPAFDSMAIAVNATLTCTVSSEERRFCIEVAGTDADLIPTDESNLVYQTAIYVANMARRTLPPLCISLFNEIPIGRGLGSSAAARVTGVLVADAILKLGHRRTEVLDIASELEGHADNAAASVFGGCMVSTRIDGRILAVPLPFPPTVRITFLIPDFRLETCTSRKVLPNTYPRTDVISGIGNTGVLVAALCAGNIEAIKGALNDRIHQPYRTPLVPGMNDVLHLQSDGLVGCALSGSGPSIVVLTSGNHKAVISAVKTLLELQSEHRWEVRHAQVVEGGYSVMSGAECYV